MKSLTAQQALERYGFILHLSGGNRRVGDVVENAASTSGVPVGTKLVIVGFMTEPEAEQFCQEVGWSTRLFDYSTVYCKVVAE